MAGYSGTRLATKVGVRPGHTLFVDRVAGEAPAELDLGDLAGVRLAGRLPRSIDVTITFHVSRATLERRLPVLLERTSTAGMVWVAWPKKSAQKARGIVSDLDDGVVRAVGLGLGFVDVKVAAIDDTWSGLKFVRRLGDRPHTPGG